MTIEIKTNISQNLFAENDVINIYNFSSNKSRILAGFSWLVEGAPRTKDILLPVLQLAIHSIKKALPQLDFWLLIGSSRWQHDSKIIRHKKLWKALRYEGYDIPLNHESIREITIESPKGLKFFGAIKLSALTNDNLIKTIFCEYCTYICAIPKNISPDDFLEVGWHCDLATDLATIDYLTQSDCLLLIKDGLFDDYEKGMVAIGKPSLIDKLQHHYHLGSTNQKQA